MREGLCRIMDEEYYFKRPRVVEVDAASVGISRSDWTSVSSESEAAVALSLMREYQYDIIPVEEQGVAVEKYFKTDQHGSYESNSLIAIGAQDLIHYRSPLEHVISRMVLNGRDFFFLTNSDDVVIGLIASCNLNCRQVGTLLFSHIIQFENLLTDLLRDTHSLEWVEENAGPSSRKRMNEARESNSELDPIQFLTMEGIINLFRKSDAGLLAILGFDSKQEFRRRYGAVRILRNHVAHPANLLIGPGRTVDQLWDTLSFMRHQTQIIRAEYDKK